MLDPLDILLPPSHELLINTDNLLSELEIPHRELVLLADATQNVAVTDGSNVFVKIYRRKDGLHEARNTLIAQHYGAFTPALLADTDWCTVWQYESLSPLPLSAVSEALHSVRHVHEATVNNDLIEVIDYSKQLAVVLGRLTKVEEGELKDTITDDCTSVCARLTSLTEDLPRVFTHSDLQFKNMGLSLHGPMIFDWEICKMAPVELEMSKLEENLYTMHDWRPGLTEELYGGKLDREILYEATKLRYLQNLAFFYERNASAVVKDQYEAYQSYCLL